MSLDRARWLLESQARQKQQDTRQHFTHQAEVLLHRLFTQQYEFVSDSARRKVALCPRQCGKSYAVLVYALYVCLRKPGARVVIIARVRRQAKGTYWSDLKQFCRDFEIKAEFRKNELECELPNGSTIQLSGADTAEEIDKHRGQRYDLICVDECKSYSDELLREMIKEVLEPATLAKRGTLVLIGTPGAIPKGLFYDLTDGRQSDKPRLDVRPWGKRETWGRPFYWSSHHWHTRDLAEGRPEMAHIWLDALAAKEAQQIPDDDPSWLREYLGIWAVDLSAMVFAYNGCIDEKTGKNWCEWVPVKQCPEHTAGEEHCHTCQWGLPHGHEWKYVLGLDIGYDDDCGFVVAAWSKTWPVLIFVHSEKHPKLVVEEIATHCRELEARFPGGFTSRIADRGGLGKMVVESLGRTYGIHFEAAAKSEKHDYIKLQNSDMQCRRIQAHPQSELVEEWKTCQWADSDHKEYDPNCDDHASDAALYVWRFCYHHWSRTVVTPPALGSPEWWKQREKAEEERARLEGLRDKSQSMLDRYRPLMDKAPGVEKLWTLRNLRR